MFQEKYAHTRNWIWFPLCWSFIWFAGHACSPVIISPPQILESCAKDADCSNNAKCSAGICLTNQTQITREGLSESVVPDVLELTDSDASVKEQFPVEKNQEPKDTAECTNGTTQPCFTGDPKHQGKGECKEGKQICTTGRWGDCKGQGKPQPEICDGKDNNCDGQIDEDLSKFCYNGPKETKNKGLCKEGKQICTAGKWSTCKDQIKPVKEICDSKDNNCDGRTDENCPCQPKDKQNCGSSKGECKEGKQTCSKDYEWGPCVDEIKPVKEICDGKDNNCNGLIDENYINKGKTCPVGTGICRRVGKYICGTDHKKLVCSASPGKSKAEICNGLDDNCDGRVDNAPARVGQDCIVAGQKGECAKSKWICRTDLKRLVCPKTYRSRTEICNNLDDDCNGRVDDRITVSPPICPVSGRKGECAIGDKRCIQGTTKCIPRTPTRELCDSKDNDCDGQTDESFACRKFERKCMGDDYHLCEANCSGFKKLGTCNRSIGRYCQIGLCKTCGCQPGKTKCSFDKKQVKTCQWDNQTKCSFSKIEECGRGKFCKWNGKKYECLKK